MSGHTPVGVNRTVFIPTLLFLLLTVFVGIRYNDRFLAHLEVANAWILNTFGWLFTWGAFALLIVLLIAYCSPLGGRTIGGPGAEPLLSRWKWFATALCTTVVTGILFWGTTEPLYHLHTQHEELGIVANTPAAATFAMSTMYMHWSFTPYGIYTTTGLVFALSYYNYGRPYRISSLLYPLTRRTPPAGSGPGLDVFCLYALMAGMAASFATGIAALMGGLGTLFGVPESNLLSGLIGLAMVTAFVASAVSGLKRGISTLANYNAMAFIALAVVVLTLGPTDYIFSVGLTGLGDYVGTFVTRSTSLGPSPSDAWRNEWTIFYFANWFAWAPVASLFLGRLAVGYTVREFIHFNLLFPSLFTCTWMAIFSGTSLSFDIDSGGALYQLLLAQGEESVMYTLLQSLPGGVLLTTVALLMVFVSYVTAADSTLSAMSSLSSVGISPANPEAPVWIKIVWGALIALIAWIMLTTAGVGGIRLLCVLGGFPTLFIILLVGAGLLRSAWRGG